MDRLNATGKLYLTHTALHGKFALRMVIGQRTTAERHVRAAWDLIREISGLLKYARARTNAGSRRSAVPSYALA